MAARQPDQINQLPEPPNPADRSTFNSRAYPWSEALKPWTDEVNAAGADTFYNALEAEAKASEADASATAAANSVIEADTAKTGAETAMVGAESARDDAQSNATAAANSATAANTAKAGAEAARDAAAQSATDAAQSAADAAAAVRDDFGPAIHYADSKITPVDADELAVADSQASWSLKKLAWGNLKAAVFAAFKVIATSGSAKSTLGLGAAATRDVGTGSGNVLEVGVSRLGENPNPQTTFNLNTDGMQHGLGLYYLAPNVGCIGTSLMSETPAFVGTEYSYSARKAYVLFGNNSAASGSRLVARYEIHTTGNILTTTGQSTDYPMSQKAVTDAIANTGALASPSANYEYDALGRVDKIVTPDGNTVIGYLLDGAVDTISYPTGRVETYTYDTSGNIVSMTATGG